MAAEKKARLESTKQELGPAGLKQLEGKLRAAQEKNGEPYPDKFLTDFPIPDVGSINWIEVETARTDKNLNSDLQKFIEQTDSTVLPFSLEFNRMSSSWLILPYLSTEIIV